MASGPRGAKRPATSLAGPYGHPFHPILVTVPIGAWVASFVFDIVSRVATDPVTFARASYWLIGLGLLGAVAAGLVGSLDLFVIPTGTRAFRVALTHMAFNLVVTAAYVVNFVVRRGVSETEVVPVGLIVLSAASLAGLAVSGWLGGMLAYRYGVRVADEATQAEGFVAAGQEAPSITQQDSRRGH